jgi:prepilin-type N-terminal cleavage/methylation domain-containing protein
MKCSLAWCCYKTGFTLAELLVSLAVLGLIATFAIPMILGTSSETTRKAKLKETVYLLNTITQDILLNNEWAGITDFTINQTTDPIVVLLDKKINATKICSLTDTAKPCDMTWHDGWVSDLLARYVLPNGVQVWLSNADNNASQIAWHIDVDGNVPPNTDSTATADQMPLICNVSAAIINNASGKPIKPGTCFVYSNTQEPNYLGLYK